MDENEFERIEVTVNHDKDYTTFDELAEFVDAVRQANSEIADYNIKLIRDDELSDHEDVVFYVEV